MAETYAEHAAADAAWRRPFVDFALARFRRWDRAASARVDRFVANSRHIATAIARCYGREADVVYPPVDVDRFVRAAATRNRDEPRSEYVTVSRLVPYKRIDLLVEAFRALPERRLVVVGDGPERSRLEALRVPNVEFAGQQEDAETARRVADARAFLFAAEEDFGIAPVEAQAAGTPVIAFGQGGARETVRGQDDAFRPARSSMRRRHRRWSPPCSRSRRMPARSSRRLPRQCAALRPGALSRRDRARRRSGVRRARPRGRRRGLDRLAMRRNLLKENSTLPGSGAAVRRSAVRRRRRRHRLPREIRQLGPRGALRHGVARRRAGRVRRVLDAQAPPVAAWHQLRRGSARLCSSPGSRSA